MSRAYRTHVSTGSLLAATLAGSAFAGSAAATTIAITEFYNNPSGGIIRPDASFAGDAGVEFIELFNYGSTPVDITGWRLLGTAGGATEAITGYFFDPNFLTTSIPATDPTTGNPLLEDDGITQRTNTLFSPGTDFILDPGEYMVMIGTQSFNSSRSDRTRDFLGGTQAVSIFDTFFDSYFEGVSQPNVGLLGRFTEDGDQDDGEQAPHPGSVFSQQAIANGSDALVLRTSAATGNQTAWSLAYQNDESSGESTFLATNNFTVTDFGGLDFTGVDRDSLDRTSTGGTVGVRYVQNEAIIVDSAGVEVLDTNGLVQQIFDPTIPTDTEGNPVRYPSINGNGDAIQDSFATPLTGPYTDLLSDPDRDLQPGDPGYVNGPDVLGPVDQPTFVAPDPVLQVSLVIDTGTEAGNDQAVTRVANLSQQTLAVKAVISGVADVIASGNNGRVIEITAVDDIPVSEFANYGINVLFNGTSGLGTDTDPFEVDPSILQNDGGEDFIPAGTKLYVTQSDTEFQFVFATTDDGGLNFDPLPNDNIVAEGGVFIDGNDVVALTINGVLADGFGTIGRDPSIDPSLTASEQFLYEDGWAYRNDNVGPNLNEAFNTADAQAALTETQRAQILGYDSADFTVAPEAFDTFLQFPGQDPIAIERNLDIDPSITNPAFIVDENGNPKTGQPFPIGTFDGSAIDTANLPEVVVGVRGDYSLAFGEWDAVATGQVEVSGLIGTDTVIFAFATELPAGGPDRATLLTTLNNSGIAFIDLADPELAPIPGVTDNPFYDGFDLAFEIVADGDGAFDIEWDFSAFVGQANSPFTENPGFFAFMYGTTVVAGDLNFDGVVDSDDIAEAFLFDGETEAFNAAIFAHLDLEADGVLDINDVIALLDEQFNTVLGDFNLDSAVDLIDLSVLATNFNGTGGYAEGDANGDGVIDLIDLSTLATNFGFSGAAIPEPASLALLGLGGSVMLRRRSA
ncbi:PEP-CTERM sorting domain-containing protein [Mucisphaera sp.]|uniref:PEP-CTERM sorting domain-containing protein n=1 Tax=Mucisphaera sp. TaxID=2913024 RepID=UPI003D0DCFC0